ncbi:MULTISPECIES: hypothetical protein [unclassified Streptomyces]|uniref:hypothetical protein n=1 Tax=unclassified Streptomyces TaxID=2593676 RepID=UPI0006AF3C55|nr:MULTISPECIES: hypothetical protein [unclassified Streptomyces]KOU80936.1 hypothetical protein ADK93_32180 [Streptomyces sp. XY58]KOV01799.1 hypothetical protein ADK89_30880 [Streptomyces sp. XY37]KOV41844.1 hypothetical protein ADK99_31330 [Streptomyces sp. MMG1064]
MRTRTTALAAAALTATAVGLAPSAAADTVTTTPLPWSLNLQTASGSGVSHWTTVTREDGYTLSRTLTVGGTLSNTGSGCYSAVVTEAVFGFPSAVHDAGRICGPGTVAVRYEGPAINGNLYLCAVAPGGGCTKMAGPASVYRY